MSYTTISKFIKIISNSFIKINTLSVSKDLADFVKNELLPGLDINEKDFWDGFDKCINELAPINKKLLEIRETLQSEIDSWLKKTEMENLIIKSIRTF